MLVAKPIESRMMSLAIVQFIRLCQGIRIRIGKVPCIFTFGAQLSQVLATTPKIVAAKEFIAHDQQTPNGSANGSTC